MAAESRITVEDKSIWISSGFVEVLSNFICQTFEIRGLSNFSLSLVKFYESCDANRTGEKAGMVDFPFLLVKSRADVEILINVFRQAQKIIEMMDAELSIDYLNELEKFKIDEDLKTEWRVPIQVSSLIGTLEILIKMLSGTWKNNSTGVYFKGFPSPEGALLV